jgi:hypothetical protein
MVTQIIEPDTRNCVVVEAGQAACAGEQNQASDDAATIQKVRTKTPYVRLSRRGPLKYRLPGTK